ncbi:MAG: NCS2 family permease [Thermodesulfobacteriota bacterium]
MSLPPTVLPVAFHMDVAAALKPVYWIPIFVFLYISLFDSMGSLTAVSYRAGLNVGDDIPALDRMFMADASGAAAGAVLGTSTVTAYIESGAGIASGGRTGWTALFTGVLFLIAPVFAGVIAVVPSYATAVALVVVGLYFVKQIREIDFSNFEEGVPAFFTILLMPLTYSIATGICFGILSYICILVISGKWRELKPVLVLIGLFSLIYLVLNTCVLGNS